MAPDDDECTKMAESISADSSQEQYHDERCSKKVSQPHQQEIIDSELLNYVMVFRFYINLIYECDAVPAKEPIAEGGSCYHRQSLQ